MSNTVKFLGTTDEVDTCDCCGRKGLKSTVALSINDGEAVYYGVTCAAHALKRSPKEVLSESHKADRARAEAERIAREQAHRAEMAPWLAFLASNGTGHDTFTRIESLGGYKAARAAYLAARAA